MLQPVNIDGKQLANDVRPQPRSEDHLSKPAIELSVGLCVCHGVCFDFSASAAHVETFAVLRDLISCETI